jgi:hypothetical protein
MDKYSKMTHFPAGDSERLRNSALKQSNPSYGWSALSLCLARVTDVYHPELRCNIEVVHGEHQRPKYTGVEISAASAGSRHFLGAIPQVGDYCMVGWVANSGDKAGRKQPIILTWMPRTPFYGHDWLPVQDFTTEEQVLNNLKDRQAVSQVAQRIRFKMRHMDQGNILASSAQGADLFLDESVLLTNRRANEIRLRDQDQAIVMRSLQQFHSMAGARVYSGMVQRDAQHIPQEMISDGFNWDGGMQVYLGEDSIGSPQSSPTLNPSEPSTDPLGKFLPNKIFLKDSEGKTEFEKEGGTLDPHLNPFSFFFEANLINESGQVTGANSGKLIYGGKSILRMDERGRDRKAKSGKPISSALSEYRVEVSHTSNGTLPVTEQTDGFDADRLASGLPLVEFVLGSVVGNDPFGVGRQSYGIPLGVSFASGQGVLVPSVTGEVGSQCATLIKVNPLSEELSDSFVSFTKNGALKAQISSLSTEALQAKVNGGGEVTLDGDLRVKSAQINLVGGSDSGNSLGVNVTSPKGAVNISAGGYITPNEGASNQDAKEAQMGVNIEARRGISIQSSSVVKLSAPIVDFTDVKSFRFSSQDSFSLASGKSLTLETSDMTETVTGNKRVVYGGPTDGLPIKSQGLEETFGSSPATGSVGGTVRKETVAFGDVEQTSLTVGDRSTSVNLGSISQSSTVGSVTLRSAGNSVDTSPESVTVKAILGDASVQSAVGNVAITGSLGVGIRSVGKVSLEAPSVVLNAGSTATGVSGAILCASDLHPLVGKTYQALGLIPRGQILA